MALVWPLYYDVVLLASSVRNLQCALEGCAAQCEVAAVLLFNNAPDLTCWSGHLVIIVFFLFAFFCYVHDCLTLVFLDRDGSIAVFRVQIKIAFILNSVGRDFRSFITLIYCLKLYKWIALYKYQFKGTEQVYLFSSLVWRLFVRNWCLLFSLPSTL